MRSFHKNKQPIYQLDEWNIIEKEFQKNNNDRNETIFSLGNGYLGMRGNIEEGFQSDVTGCKGSYINGFYESEEIIYGEYQYAFPLWGQTMLNIMNAQSIELFFDDERLTMDMGHLEAYSRVLHMKDGKVTRQFTWQSPTGKKVEFNIEKFISLKDIHITAFQLSVRALNFSGIVRIITSINGDVRNENLKEQALVMKEKGVVDNTMYLLQQTKETKFDIACGMMHYLRKEGLKNYFNPQYIIEEKEVKACWEIKVEKDQLLILEKFTAFDANRKYEKKKVLENAIKEVKRACKMSYKELLLRHTEFLKEFWEKTDVIIKGDLALQQGIRFNMLQLLQSVGRDGYTNIAAKGLTGEGYEGHYFWDTETYILPFFLYNNPEIAKSLVMYRYNTLNNARERARELDHPGALYPWRTIGGEETSAYFEASTAQYHINADVVYAIKKYVEATEDKEFLVNYGVEVVWETARLWADRGGFIPMRGNKFCIHEVTGPDEYKAGVDNNCYTNYMAQMHLYYAVELAEWFKKEASEKYLELKRKLELQEEEILVWKKAADNMYLPYNEELGINPQDDSFIYKELYDIEEISVERLPLVFNWHPLNIWRYQICKQADVLLLMLLLSEKFSVELKKANFDYYEPKTTHDSSLSACIFSVIASEVGYKNYAYNYFMQTARMDLDDYNNNAHKGLHTASMAGAWMCVVNGFAGMRVFDEMLHFKPYTPEKWDAYKFSILYKGRRLTIEVNQKETTYTLQEGKKLNFYHYEQEIQLCSGNNRIIIEDN